MEILTTVMVCNESTVHTKGTVPFRESTNAKKRVP